MPALQITPALRVFFTLTYTETVYIIKVERYTETVHRRCIMADLDLKLDGIANGLLVEQTDKKKADADKKKRMYASAFAYIRNQTGMNKKEFAEYLGIPYRTLQDWELGNTQAPEYVLRLIAYKVMWEKERGNL